MGGVPHLIRDQGNKKGNFTFYNGLGKNSSDPLVVLCVL